MSLPALNVEATPAFIKANFDQVREHLSKELERFDVVVTEDTVADCKKLATELNKLRGEIDTRRKEEVAKASEPVRQFDDQMKELVEMCKTGRQRLLDQIERFDRDKLDRAESLLIDYMVLQLDNAGIRQEFSPSKSPVAKLTSLTQTGNLTAAAKAEVDAIVAEAKALQDRTDQRLVDLELECRRAGMDHPLERQHVEAFLMADDGEYASRLQLLISTELERVERIRQAEAAKAERAAQAAAEAAERDAQRREEEARASARAEAEAAQRQAQAEYEARISAEIEEQQTASTEPGIVRINAVFEVELTGTMLENGFTPDRLLEAFKTKLVKNGFEKSFRGAQIS